MGTDHNQIQDSASNLEFLSDGVIDQSMSRRSEAIASPDIPQVLTGAPTTERRLHQQLLLDNIEFLIDTLYGEQLQRGRKLPAGCRTATPESIARKQNSGRCHLGDLPTGKTMEQDGCVCSDPLSGSTDPLDAVVAVSLCTSVDSPAEYYFQTTERRTVADLRSSVGSWEEIHDLNRSQLRFQLEDATPRKAISERRVGRVERLLDAVAELRYTDGVTLTGFANTSYERYADSLSDLPGVDEDAAWWLVLSAFDKPVWPTGPSIDRLLCSLGLIAPNEVQSGESRHEKLESELTDRLIPVLHRALAAHAVTAGIDSCEDNCEIRKFLLSHRIRQQQKKIQSNQPTVIDLFAGAGGLSHGLSRSGFDICWAIDNESDAVATFRLNHPEVPHKNVVCEDIREVDIADRVKDTVGSPDVIVGGPPCQSLSVAGYRSRLASDKNYSVLDDDRTDLYTQYIETIDELRPKALVMENVEGMVSEVGNTGQKVIDSVIAGIEELGSSEDGYSWEYRLVNVNDLGVPQKRERVIVIGVRNDVVSQNDVDVTQLFDAVERMPDAGAGQDLKQGLSGLPRLLRGEGGNVVVEKPPGRRSAYVEKNGLSTGTDLCFNHLTRRHKMEKDQKLFDEALEPGETGWDVKYDKEGDYADLIEYDVGTEENPRFKDKYRMLEWDEPAPTIVAHLAKDANSFVIPDYYEYAHPDKSRRDNRRNRGITPREAARIQSFPDEFIFLGPFTSWFRQIGNAVPPLAAERIGTVLNSMIFEESTSSVSTGSSPAEKATSDD